MTDSADTFDQPLGATPIDEDDRAGLIPTWIATRDDLNVAERAGIAGAIMWAESKAGPHTLSTLLTETMLRELHRQMFGDVWSWAGTYRHHDTNIGAPWPYVTTLLRDLLADARVQTADPDRFPWSADEVAVRFHHRLTSIHPFPNGNGRHARLAADIFVALLGEPVFSWGAEELIEPTATRKAYIDALVLADRTQDYSALITFARS